MQRDDQKYVFNVTRRMVKTNQDIIDEQLVSGKHNQVCFSRGRQSHG